MTNSPKQQESAEHVLNTLTMLERLVESGCEESKIDSYIAGMIGFWLHDIKAELREIWEAEKND